MYSWRVSECRYRREGGVVRLIMVRGALCLCLLIHASVSYADDLFDGSVVSAHFGPYVYHYSESSSKNSFPWFLLLEWESASHWEIGASYFRNSYYQPSGYVYGGKRWLFGPKDNHFFLKLTAGAILGYVKPYDGKIPLNYNGIGLGIIPAIGYKYHRVSTQLAVIGNAGLLMTVGYDIWK